MRNALLNGVRFRRYRSIARPTPLSETQVSDGPASRGLSLSEPASISSGIASRYATAVFSLAKDDKKLKPLEADVDVLESALSESADLRALALADSSAIKALARAIGLLR